jgi:hypothetical protein
MSLHLPDSDVVGDFFKIALCPKCNFKLELVLGSINYYWHCESCGFWIVGPLRQLVELEVSKNGS